MYFGVSPQAVSCIPGNRGHEICSFTNPEDTESSGPLNFEETAQSQDLFIFLAWGVGFLSVPQSVY